MHRSVLILYKCKTKYKNNANLDVQSTVLAICNYNTGSFKSHTYKIIKIIIRRAYRKQYNIVLREMYRRIRAKK